MVVCCTLQFYYPPTKNIHTKQSFTRLTTSTDTLYISSHANNYIIARMIAAHDMEHNDNNRNNEEEDYNEDEDVWNIKDTKLNEETLRKICNNDSSITALSIVKP